MLNIYNQHVDNKDLHFNLMEKPSREQLVNAQSQSLTLRLKSHQAVTLSINEPVPSGPVAMVAVANEWRYYIIMTIGVSLPWPRA